MRKVTLMSIGQLPRLLGANSNPICFPLECQCFVIIASVPMFSTQLCSVIVAASAITVSSAVWAPLLLSQKKQSFVTFGPHQRNLETGDAILYLLRGRVLNRP